jgi:hypothetical protein
VAPVRRLAFSQDGEELLAACGTVAGGPSFHHGVILWRLDAADVRVWRKRIMSRAEFAIGTAQGFVVGEGAGVVLEYDRAMAKTRVLRAKPDSGLRSDLAHLGPLSEACVDPTGRFLYTISRSPKGGEYRTDVRAWDAASGGLLHVFPMEDGGSYATVDVSNDGALVLCGTHESGVVELRLAAGMRGETDD